MEYVLSTNALSKKYKNFKALDGLNMHVPKGAIYGFVGKNGAGKTTLIRLLCGMQFPTAGEFTLYGKSSNTKDILNVRKRMGAVVETPAVTLEMTAKENIMQQYRMLGLPSFSDVDELLDLVGLNSTGDKKVKNFSLGMKQRLGIAIALAGNPDLLVLDEPINGLDPEGIIEIRELILKLNKEKQITILISSHILDELAKLATHYGFVNHGQLVKEISAVDLLTECKKCTHVTVSDTKILVRVLDDMELEYQVISSTEADIYGQVSVTDLAIMLSKQNCQVFSMNEIDESLENYYINLIGGSTHE